MLVRFLRESLSLSTCFVHLAKMDERALVIILINFVCITIVIKIHSTARQKKIHPLIIYIINYEIQ